MVTSSTSTTTTSSLLLLLGSRRRNAQEVLLVAVVALVLLVGLVPTVVVSQVGGISSECQQPVASIATCLGFVTNGNDTHPDTSCCTPLKTVLSSDPLCLCEVLGSAGAAYSVNGTKAIALPTLCKLGTVPYSCPGSQTSTATNQDNSSSHSFHNPNLLLPLTLAAGLALLSHRIA